MDLTSVMSVEHADRYSDGCLLHRDPECLCDVKVTDPITTYDIPAGMAEAWSSWDNEDDPDGWFDTAFIQMSWDTWRRAEVVPVAEVWGLVQNHPTITDDLLAGETASAISERYGCGNQQVGALARLMNLPDQSTRNAGKRNAPLREMVVDLFEQGLSAADAHHHIEALGYTNVLRPTLCKWIQRFSVRYAEENPDTTLLGKVKHKGQWVDPSQIGGNT